jgi:hypothetical protein
MAKEKAQLNNLSPEYRKQIQKIIEGREVHQFRLTIGRIFKKPMNDGTFQDTLMFPSTYGMKVRDAIIDPKTRELVNIAVVSHYDDNDNPVFLQKWIDGDHDGFFSLRASEPQDRAWLEFIYASNYLENNENRNKQVEPEYRIYDEAFEAKLRNQKRDYHADALIQLRRMTAEKIVDFAASLGWDETDDIELLKDKVGAMVSANPDLFLSMVQNEGPMEHKSVLKRCITKGLAGYDASNQTVTFKGTVIAKLEEPGKGETYLDRWSEWVLTAPAGLKIFEQMKKEADATNKVAKSA